MESNSKANGIHCSKAAAELLEIQKPGISLTARGHVNVKGKGLMRTYWVNQTNLDMPNSRHSAYKDEPINIKNDGQDKADHGGDDAADFHEE